MCLPPFTCLFILVATNLVKTPFLSFGHYKNHLTGLCLSWFFANRFKVHEYDFIIYLLRKLSINQQNKSSSADNDNSPRFDSNLPSSWISFRFSTQTLQSVFLKVWCGNQLPHCYLESLLNSTPDLQNQKWRLEIYPSNNAHKNLRPTALLSSQTQPLGNPKTSSTLLSLPLLSCSICLESLIVYLWMLNPIPSFRSWAQLLYLSEIFTHYLNWEWCLSSDPYYLLYVCLLHADSP